VARSCFILLFPQPVQKRERSFLAARRPVGVFFSPFFTPYAKAQPSPIVIIVRSAEGARRKTPTSPTMDNKARMLKSLFRQKAEKRGLSGGASTVRETFIFQDPSRVGCPNAQ
jgi:hypothetical protein